MPMRRGSVAHVSCVLRGTAHVTGSGRGSRAHPSGGSTLEQIMRRAEQHRIGRDHPSSGQRDSMLAAMTGDVRRCASTCRQYAWERMRTLSEPKERDIAVERGEGLREREPREGAHEGERAE